MEIAIGIILGVAVLVLLTAFICFMRVFYIPTRKILKDDEFEIPPDDIYQEMRDELIGWMKAIRGKETKQFTITSFDGLTLYGYYYEYEKGAPIELLFHGYQGSAERDLSAAVERCFALGRSAILIDQRAGGRSDGHVTTFGINEHKDCLRWIDFAIEKFGADVKLYIGGVSMGAATVMMAGGKGLPKNVVYVLADCGYSSQAEMIQKVIKEMKLPVKFLYPFVKLGAKIFGRFDLEETTPIESIKNCKTPIIFLHGDNDTLVPCEMSERLYNECPAPKKFAKIKGAGHGLAYPKDKESYLNAIKEFDQELGL